MQRPLFIPHRLASLLAALLGLALRLVTTVYAGLEHPGHCGQRRLLGAYTSPAVVNGNPADFQLLQQARQQLDPGWPQSK